MHDRPLHWRITATGEVLLNDATSAGGGLILHLAHATREGADLHLDMQRTAHGVWRAALPPLSPGKW